jgi:hypothetical protein
MDGLYRGKVVEVSDNSDQVGFCRVHIPQIHGQSYEEESIPWASPCMPFPCSASGRTTRGMVSFPRVGDQLWVGFELGDLSHPVYFGGFFWREGGNKTTFREPFATEEGDINSGMGFCDGSGDYGQWVFAYEGDRIEMRSAKGSVVSTHTDGSIDVTAEDSAVAVKTLSGEVNLEFGDSMDTQIYEYGDTPVLKFKAKRRYEDNDLTVDVNGSASRYEVTVTYKSESQKYGPYKLGPDREEGDLSITTLRDQYLTVEVLDSEAIDVDSGSKSFIYLEPQQIRMYHEDGVSRLSITGFNIDISGENISIKAENELSLRAATLSGTASKVTGFESKVDTT